MEGCAALRAPIAHTLLAGNGAAYRAACNLGPFSPVPVRFESGEIRVDLPPEIAHGTASIVPCFSARLAADYGYCAVLEGARGVETMQAALAPVGCFSGSALPAASNRPPIRSDIDTFMLEGCFDALTLRVYLTASSSARLSEDEWLLSIACRSPVEKSLEPDAAAVGVQLSLPALSQMEVPDIGTRICSPTSVAMVLQSYGIAAAPLAVAQTAFCAQHDLFGVWPWNVYAASRYGILGFIACFDDWDTPRRLLGRGIPLVTSIRYGKGELTGAALERENDKPLGHLVVLRGCEGEKVLVHDPAAPQAAAVPRRYEVKEFLKVWLSRSAVAYVLLPPQ